MLKLVILELPKVPGQADSGVWPWLRFFKCERKEDYEMLTQEYPELKKAVFCARRMSLLARWCDYQFHKNLWKEDERMLLLQARTDGHTEGLAEGETKGEERKTLEFARKMKNRGRPLAEIIEDTGLSAETGTTSRHHSQLCPMTSVTLFRI